ncbi:TonB-dependent receptor plug domain-containing protein [Vibrio sinaloensis]|uniref:TonB-dependent receptor plug domain-containing protein n=1 Tax=Photobacterium sp. (strain ATCC 43367) TaxID=379097 RepID=UPI000580739C|nr:TonB-dependent receptor [Vibrio sinaloensis]KHT51707.1 TonB-dependent receptor [Vibrio sinaloensis]
MYKRSILFTSLSLAGCAVFADDNLDELMSMSLEELSMLDVAVETASKFSQKVSDVPASVYVLSSERIQRSGATNIQEALALVPGMYVTKWNENTYHVSSRGFHDGLYNKMLVMVDGRSVYSPVYGGVYWSALDYILADIERIEVIRGASGAIWGGNAANGVVNIITKSAQDTQGTYMTGTAGRYNAYDYSLRHGLKLDEDLYARAFYKSKSNPSYLNNSASKWKTDTAGIELSRKLTDSSWQFRVGGTKLAHDAEVWTVAYDRNDPYNQPVTITFDNERIQVDSAYVQLNHQKQLDSSSLINTSFWVDHVKDESPDAPGEYTTVDLESNYSTALSAKHDLIAGIGLRYVGLRFTESWQDADLFTLTGYSRSYDIDKANDYIANVFAQSTYQISEQLSSVIGVKGEYFEQNKTFELSPQLRLLYTPSHAHRFWTGIGRAVVTPSYMDSNSIYQQSYIEWYGGTPYGSTYLTLPNEKLKNESVWTGELGYRYMPSERVELDGMVFYSRYDNIRGNDCFDSLVYQGYEHLWFCFVSDDYQATTSGVELAAHYQAADNLSFYATYSYLRVDADWDKGTYSNGGNESSLSLPSQHLATLQTLWSINKNWQWDFALKYNNTRYTDEMRADYDIPGRVTLDDVTPHVTLDTRLGWRKNDSAPLVELVVQKMFANEIYDSWSLYPNEQLAYVRLSHEF